MITITINPPSSLSEVQNIEPLSMKGMDEISFESPNTIDKNEKSETLIINSPSTKETTVHGLSSDGKIRVEIVASNPIPKEPMAIDIKFRDSSGTLKKFANYDILVKQNSKELLSAKNVHAEDGNGKHTTIPLNSEEQVDFIITILGFGSKEDQNNWTGPRGEILMFNVIPEFGTISVLILIVSMIISITIVAKSKNLIILRKYHV